MASIHIDEIRKLLINMGRGDRNGPDGRPVIEFLEIRFDDARTHSKSIVDEDYVNAVLSIETPSASGVIQFDHHGYLRSIDFC